MRFRVPKDDLQECPRCGERSAYLVRRGGFVSLECDLCDYYELKERPKEVSLKDAKQMRLHGVI